MCLAVPGRIREILGDTDLRIGKIDFGGIVREARLDFLPEAQIGDYVLVHVGIAISRVDEEEAHRTLELLREAGVEIADESGGEAEAADAAPPPAEAPQ
jgi:hydrogenase expression/formation protein HypC